MLRNTLLANQRVKLISILSYNGTVGQLILPFTLGESELATIDRRLTEFAQLHREGNALWFSELCFCLLTANAQAKKALALQLQLGPEGFLTKSERELAAIIRSHSHRFHNTKAHYIVQARRYARIKDILLPMPLEQAREFLVTYIKGLGYKEASHFLRNVGYHDVAIIDRHIVKFLVEYSYIDDVPKVITKKIYLTLEALLRSFGLALDKLDLMIWYHMTGQILK
jgi:N-glycosylase/DNA lyase